MKVSAKNKKITLQKPNLVSDGIGGRKPAAGKDKWQDVATVWADIWKPSLQTVESTGTVVSEMFHKLLIWRRADVRKGWRVLYGTKIFSVEHAHDYETSETMLVCKEVVK